MFQKDYILRMVEMIGELIAMILGLIKKGDLEQAEKILERGYMDFLRKDAAFFHSLSNEKLTTGLIKEHHYQHGHLSVLAELFFAEGELCENQGKPERASKCYEKSLVLLEFLEKEDRTWSEKREERISVIRKKVAALNANKKLS
jgi:tetratricopeptide (TPR) repeat protein